MNTKQKPKPAQGRDGRFLSGNVGGGGRPVGSRNKLSEAFLGALCDDFQQHGTCVIEQVRQSEPAAYLRVIASAMPRKFEVEPIADVASLSDAQLDAIIAGSLASKGIKVPTEEEAVRQLEKLNGAGR